MAITVGQLQSFITVVRAGSVTAAAEELWVTQPSVSAALSALSREVGVEFFERNGRRLALSPAGEAFARYATDVLGLLTEGVIAAREASGAAALRVRIAAVTTAGEHLAPLLIREFTSQRQDVTVELHVGNRDRVFQLLRARDADVAIAGRPPMEADVMAVPFLKNEIVLVTAPEDELAGRPCTCVGELADRTWLLREEGSGTRAMSEEFLASHGLRPKILSLGSNGAIKQAARLGLGISLQSRVAIDSELRYGELGMIALPEPAADRHWFAIRCGDGAVREPVASFLSFVDGVERIPELERWAVAGDELAVLVDGVAAGA
jgi:DNA-binding transcriptional LysR family regulator